MLYFLKVLWVGLFCAVVGPAWSAPQTYKIDPSHSFVMFRISHLGISTTIGQFPGIEGSINFDENDLSVCSVKASLNPSSVDTNHAERDKHLRGKDFLHTDKFTLASFASKQCKGDKQSGTLSGDLVLMGVTKPIEIKVTKVGEGPDPWGGYRAGFKGEFEISRKDFGLTYNLGPKSETVTLEVFLEGIRS